MIPSHIISLANTKVELRFKVMVRSLRATGCDLPVLVIPYDDNRFDLPDGCEWLESDALYNFLRANKAHPMLRKYVCLTHENYQFVDSDVVFLRDPRDVLRTFDGFITSCGNWRDPTHTLTEQLRVELESKTTMWQWHLFNAGQFACDRVLYSLDRLLNELLEPSGHTTILGNPYHDQPGLNLLVCRSGVSITNLTLPPLCMESTWAGDYPEECESYWKVAARKPYLIHWAGHGNTTHRPIDQYYLSHMSPEERACWDKECVDHDVRNQRGRWSLRGLRARLGRAYRASTVAWKA